MKSADKKIKNILSDAFEVTMVVKAADGLLEVLSFLLLFFVINPARIYSWVITLTAHELIQDPNDRIANYMVETAKNLSISTTHFAAFYILAHGLTKIILVCLLWKKKIWAYPVMIFFLFSFVIYQFYRYTHTHAIILIILSVFDAITALLTWNAFQQARLVQNKKDNDNVNNETNRS